jgi:putative methyltransferase
MANKGTVRYSSSDSILADIQVHAFERSEGRYKTLEKMLGRAGCSNVLPRRADFLDSKPDDKEFSKVTRM